MSTVRACDAATIAEAAAELRAGGLVAFPTETVYGLGADATDGTALARLFEAKGRPRFNPLIVHVPDLAAAEAHGALGDDARRLAEAFWPGPLTLVVPRRVTSPVHDLATAGLPTLAIRVPAHPAAQALLRAAGRPVAAPSANRSGRVSPTRAEHVAADLSGRIAFVLDGGPCPVGVESTIVAATGDELRLLRPGGVPVEAMEEVAGRLLSRPDAAGDDARPTAPGQLASHYAPHAPVRLAAGDVRRGEALLAFGPRLPTGAGHAVAVINLSPRGDLAEAAANLFAALRALDRPDVSAIAVQPIPAAGLGLAINDRLSRAAAPRPGSSPAASSAH